MKKPLRDSFWAYPLLWLMHLAIQVPCFLVFEYYDVALGPRLFWILYTLVYLFSLLFPIYWMYSLIDWKKALISFLVIYPFIGFSCWGIVLIFISYGFDSLGSVLFTALGGFLVAPLLFYIVYKFKKNPRQK